MLSLMRSFGDALPTDFTTEGGEDTSVGPFFTPPVSVPAEVVDVPQINENFNVGLAPNLTYAQQQAVLQTIAPQPSITVSEPGVLVAPAGATTGVFTTPLPGTQSNPASVAQVNANKPLVVNPNAANASSLISSMANALAAGGNALTGQQLLAMFNQAKTMGQSFTIPHSTVALAKKSSSGDWLIAAGIGVAVLAVFAVIAKGRQ